MATPQHIARLREFVGTELLIMPAATALVRDGAGRLLLVRHAGDAHRWGIPGGCLEIGETPAAGAVREVAEETGVDVRLHGIVDAVGGPGYEVQYANGDRVAYVSTIFHGVAVGGTPRPDGDEIAEVRWFRRDELAGLELTSYARHALGVAGLLAPDPGFAHEVRVRYADCDQQGVVFNGHYLTYADDAVDAWFTAALAPGFDCMVRKATVEWASSARHGETLTLRPRVNRWGRTSFDVTVEGSVGARPVFEAVLHYVSVAPGTADPTPVPDEVRAALTRRPRTVLLTTERLVLRRFTADDVDLLVELDADPEVLRHVPDGRATPRAEVEAELLPRYLAYYEVYRGFGFFAAQERASGEFLGWFHLRPPEGADFVDAELGYRLRRSAWGKGFATEGARALVELAFVELGARRVHAGTMTANTASRRVLEKAGLRLVRTFPEESLEYAMTRDEWAQMRSTDLT
ncbi:hypothetical protein Val02_18030 [Virgisporangium aliadipatigenens]|uniref:Uncharacterized protein n=1 Tax=Virgisporangium aliadipatigenens TaxID=741659 RepID=A0A8J3YIH0_9ACTN|nr:GNAT family N-acetyltransferase [Virgisporangium aliadipatigenens]GIJ44917.1 hypothetical protein Val02_18030 [Virgisporangium aliadipatigenens]